MEGVIQRFLRHQVGFCRRGNDADTQRFRQQQHIACLCAAVGEHFIGMDKARHRHAVFGLGVKDTVTARNECACFIDLVVAAAQHIVDGLLRHIGRNSHNVQRQFRLAAHGVHIGEGVGGGNGAKSVGIVGDRGEEVHRLHQCQIVADAIDAGIVALIKAHQQIGITVDADALQ